MPESNEYYQIREQIIETCFYITKYVGEKDYLKVKAYQAELNNLINNIIEIKNVPLH